MWLFRASRSCSCWDVQRAVSAGRCCSRSSRSLRRLEAKISLAPSRERAYLARVEEIRFFPKDTGTV
jgi:hypothetical protein